MKKLCEVTKQLQQMRVSIEEIRGEQLDLKWQTVAKNFNQHFWQSYLHTDFISYLPDMHESEQHMQHSIQAGITITTVV